MDAIETKSGRLLLRPSGELRAEVASGGSGVWRPASAGHSVGADIVDAVLADATNSLNVTRGRLEVVRAKGERAPGTEPAVNGPRERAISVDMTNWSIIVDERHIVKVVSRWGSADRAARQLTHLASVGSQIVPAFRGRLDWVHPERGRSTVALVSDLIDDSTDGWTWAVDDALAFVSGGARPDWPARVGELAADLHAALLPAADPPNQAPRGAELRFRGEAALDEAIRLTDGAAGIRLRNREPALRRAIASLPDKPRGALFDLHGDLHVGQILRSPSEKSGRYRFIDFDGDPQLEPSERDRPDLAARDVSHLLSSVELVGSVALKRLGVVEPAVLAWSEQARIELLDAYRGRLEELGYRSDFDERLLEGMVAERLLRELIYAVRFLPRWQYAADAAITFRYPAEPATGSLDTEISEEPWTPPAFTTT